MLDGFAYLSAHQHNPECALRGWSAPPASSDRLSECLAASTPLTELSLGPLSCSRYFSFDNEFRHCSVLANCC